MYTNIIAVALRTVRHNDRTSVLTAWSPTQGRLSLLMPAGKGRESMRRRAVTMPLGLFEGIVSQADAQGLSYVKDVKPWARDGRVTDVSTHPVRSVVAMFVAEVLTVVTREGDADPALWQLIVETADVIAVSSAPRLANLPVMFLLRLADLLGIQPDTGEWKSGLGFDTAEGVFRLVRPVHNYWLNADETRVAVVMARAAAAYRHLGLPRLPRPVRNSLLDALTDYFTLHHYPLNRLRSPAVLHDLFS